MAQAVNAASVAEIRTENSDRAIHGLEELKAETAANH
jgi:hypothetical protein